ncbi:aminopeptidase P family protein [bacterium]|nr:aminopeptidase P family protein [bacterium]
MDRKSEVIKKRQSIVRAQIKRYGWDALWIVSPANRRYLTGFTGSAGWVLIPARGKAILITDGRYQEQASQESPLTRLSICPQDPHNHLAELLKKQQIKQLGFEDEKVTVCSWSLLRRLVPGLKGKKASGCVETFRLCKNKEEIQYIKKAVHIAQKAYAGILPKIKVGIREIDLAMLLEKEMMQAGGQGLAFPTIVAAGPNSSLPHAQPTQRQLRAKDLVVLDFGCKYNGYNSDLTRTIVIAKMTAKQHEMYKIVKKAQVFAQKELKTGNLSANADKKARQILQKAGLAKYFIHSLGHGMGLEIHEGPKLSSLSKERLDTGMVVTCEPGVYLPGWGGIRIEDDILVQGKNPIWLSHSEPELKVVGRK